MARKSLPSLRSVGAAPAPVSLPSAPAPEERPATVSTTPAVTPRLIVAQRKFNRWYVYFKGVHPRENVGRGCHTAKSALRYMYLLRRKWGAHISQNVYDRLMFEASREA